MKCLHVLPMNKLSGAEKLVLILCKSMKKYKPVVVCGGENLKSVFEKEGIKTYSIDFKNKIKSTQNIKNIIKDENIDIIHAHDNNASVVSYLTKKLYNLDTKLISHIHSCYPWLKLKNKTKTIDTFLRKKYDHNIACGNLVYDYYKKHTDYITNENMSIISNAIDIENIKVNKSSEIYEEFNIPKDKKIIGYVGRLIKLKGIDLFIEELKDNKDKFEDCIILIVGSGLLEDEIKEKIKKYNIEDLVILTGQTTDVYKFYQVIDILFLSSIYEGLPMVILEAMSVKKPVVSMDVGSINEVVIHNENGFLVEPKNYQEFIDYLYKLKSDETMIRKFGENAFNKINENYNIKNYEKEVSKLYDSLLNK